MQNQRFKRSFLILVLCLTVNYLQARILMLPYLQGVTSDAVWVIVECDSRDTVTVIFGVEPRVDQVATTIETRMTTAGTFVHGVKLTRLDPATRYRYRVKQADSSTASFSFYTAAIPGMPFRMAWAGDSRTGTGVFKAIVKKIQAADPMVMLLGGDLCGSGSYSSWKKEFFVPEMQQLASNVPFFNTPGNHEGWNQNTLAFTRGPASHDTKNGYFSFDFGDLHILCLNQELPLSEGAPQFDFASRDLMSSKAAWKMVMTHAPAYCSGGHGGNKEMIALTTKILEPAGVDLVVAGHSHFYQHNLINGIIHLVAGSAGAPLQKPVAASYTVKQVKDYNYLIIDVSATRMKIFVYNDRDEVLDFISLDKPGTHK